LLLLLLHLLLLPLKSCFLRLYFLLALLYLLLRWLQAGLDSLRVL
jgi:hypothetical protein